ncbi:MAG: hypothetical protein V4723_12195 [Pseudomonadota bacterium]
MALNTVIAKINKTEFVGVVRSSALNVLETAQAKLERAQHDGRSVIAGRILVSAQHASNFSEFLTGLSAKVAPVAKAKRRKAVVKAAPKAAVKRPAVRRAKAA